MCPAASRLEAARMQEAGMGRARGFASPRGLGGLFSFPFKRVEARAGLATALGMGAAEVPVQTHQLGGGRDGFRGSGILKRASLQAAGFKSRFLLFRELGRLAWRRKDAVFWQGIKLLRYFNAGDLYLASSARGCFP